MLSTSFLEFIKKEKLFHTDEHLLLAVSGGLDSVLLAHLLKQHNYKFSMAHMNFQLRGEDSYEDEEFVKKLAHQLDVKIYIKRVEIKKEAGSTQIQARDLRYKWFRDLMKSNSFDKLLTGHHANDLLESALLNLSRGAGIRGIRSILPIHDQIARPLLFAEKAELKQFAMENAIEWREDVSNLSDDYTRNKVRHHVVPELQKLNPKLISGFQQTALRLRATEAAWDEKLEDVSNRYFNFERNGVVIEKSFLEVPYALVYLAELISQYGFTLSQLQSFDFDRTGAQLISRKYVLTVDRHTILLNKSQEEDFQNSFPLKFAVETNLIELPLGSLKLDFVNNENLQFDKNNKTVFIDVERFRSPFEIDIWQHGDKIQPLGMKGKKKISDILIDQKVPLSEKNRIMVLRSGGEVAWVIGYKFSDLFKVSKQASKVLRMQYRQEQ